MTARTSPADVDPRVSARMGRVRSVDTTPELRVRRLAHRLGYRFRLHLARLPGRPDLAFPARRKAIFVHGCFWHRHPHCRKASVPAVRPEYWAPKFAANVARDARVLAALAAQGWSTLVIWECETRDSAKLERALARFLGPPGAGATRDPC